MTRRRPLVALVHSVPLVSEALAGALEEVGDLHVFRAGEDTAGLLASLRPDAVVVDGEAEAAVAHAFAASSGAVAVYLSPSSGRLEVSGADGWEPPAVADASPETVRNVLVGLLVHAERPA